MPQLTFKRNAHISYFKRCLTMLPSSAETHDGNRITIAYFCLSALDLLGALDNSFTETERQRWIEWVWKLQANQGGFRGSTFMKSSTHSSEIAHSDAWTDPGHLPSTYTALLVLGILRAPTQEWVDKLDIDGLERFLCTCVDVNGSFSPVPHHAQPSQDPDNSSPSFYEPSSPPFQSDARMAYCAAVSNDITKLAKYPYSRHSAPYTRPELPLGKSGREDVTDAAGMPVTVETSLATSWQKRTRQWLTDCQTWEGGFGQHPGLEAQGGTTYCAITSLSLLHGSTGPDDWKTLIDFEGATRYLVSRQLGGNFTVTEGNDSMDDTNSIGGFQGRPGKDEDVCYSFWCGSAMRVLHARALFDIHANTRALLDSQSPMGGFGKAKGDYPDPYHSYLALAALAMNEHETTNSNPVAGLRTECTEPQPGIHAPAKVSSEQPRYPSLGLKALDPHWNVTMDTREFIERCLGEIYTQKYEVKGTPVPL